MIFHLRAVQATILATCSALALMTAALGDQAHAEGKLDASYMISFARIRVGEIIATQLERLEKSRGSHGRRGPGVAHWAAGEREHEKGPGVRQWTIANSRIAQFARPIL
jgi:hypothetical protein